MSENAGAQPVAAERKKLGIALKRVAAQEDWVTEAYVSEAMNLDRYKEDMDKLTSHRKELDRPQREVDQCQRQKQDTQKALARLERFCHQVSKGLTPFDIRRASATPAPCHRTDHRGEWGRPYRHGDPTWTG